MLNKLKKFIFGKLPQNVIVLQGSSVKKFTERELDKTSEVITTLKDEYIIYLAQTDDSSIDYGSELKAINRFNGFLNTLEGKTD